MRRGSLIVWFAGTVFGLASEAAAWDWYQQGRWVPDLVVGLALLSCGHVAVRLRPASWSGWLLMATGIAWFAPNFSDVEPAFVGQCAAALLFAHRGPFLHMILTYPNGRTSSHLVRSAVVLSYAAAVGQAFWPHPELAMAVALIVLLVALGRYTDATRSQRRPRLFALVAAVVWAVVIGGGQLVRSLSFADRLHGELLVAYGGSMVILAIMLTLGLRSAWSDRALMTDLVVELGVSPNRWLRDELATCLGDPELQVGYWVAEQMAYIDIEGRPVQTPIDAGARSTTSVEWEGAPVAVLIHDAAVLSDATIVDAVGAAVRLVTANARLQAEVLRRVDDVTASRRRIVEAADEERTRLASRAREGALHRLAELGTMLDLAFTTASGPQSRLQIDTARHQLARTQEHLDRLARGIGPHRLMRRGLEAALSDLAGQSPLPLEVVGSVGHAPAAVQIAAYFVCSEALTNAIKHSRAASVRVALATPHGFLLVEVSDDGVGGAAASRGSGLQGITDRVEALGGTLELVSPLAGGTRLLASFPISPGPGAS